MRTTTMTAGWDNSADAWIASLGEAGDWGRQFVLDRPMLAAAIKGSPQGALDVGCWRGRASRQSASIQLGV